MTFLPGLIIQDWMADFKTWLATHPVLEPLHGGRVFFRIPSATPGSPFVRIYQSGGGTAGAEAPISDPRVGLEIWGTQASDYQQLRVLEAAVASAFLQIEGTVVGNTRFGFGNVTSAVDAPDPDTGWPRRVADVSLRILSAT